MAEQVLPLLSVADLKVHFAIRSGVLQRRVGEVKAVDGVSFSINAGETLGLVGESGCGKSTTGLAMMGLVQATEGRIVLDGAEEISQLRKVPKSLRRRMQIIFQDPFSSLNPRQRVRDIIRAPLDIHDIGTVEERREAVARLLPLVGLRSDHADNFPHQFSGGQRQRIGIARALALRPDIIICDEPVSALDVSVQAQILNLLSDLQKEMGLSYLFISHDLGVVEHVSHRVAVMYLGRIVETGPKQAIFSRPLHPYSELLLQSAPSHDPHRRHTFSARSDDIPSATRKPSGCAFHTRCPLATDICRSTEPSLEQRPGGQSVACHHR
ncbi:ABC transporter ATP-binding protein [Rhizobium binxianense]